MCSASHCYEKMKSTKVQTLGTYSVCLMGPRLLREGVACACVFSHSDKWPTEASHTMWEAGSLQQSGFSKIATLIFISLKSSLSLTCWLDACSARSHGDTWTDKQTKYHNPRGVCAPRVNKFSIYSKSDRIEPALNVPSQLYANWLYSYM